jgi:hypothetical protein
MFMSIGGKENEWESIKSMHKRLFQEWLKINQISLDRYQRILFVNVIINYIIFNFN